MATAPPELRLRALWPSALLWVGLGGWAFERLPPDGQAGVWLALGWLALLLRARLTHGRSPCCPTPLPRWSDLAMGLMMGTLWWHAHACQIGTGPAAQWVALHLGLMAAPLCMTPALRQRLSRGWAHGLGAGLWLLALALAVAAPTHAGAGLGLMGVLSLAWATEPVRRSARWPAGQPGWRDAAMLAGPGGLWWVHQAWPTAGPAALWQVLAALAGLAGLASMAALAARAHARHTRTSTAAAPIHRAAQGIATGDSL